MSNTFYLEQVSGVKERSQIRDAQCECVNTKEY